MPATESAEGSYAAYRGSEDELADQFANSCITYYDRLRDIVGYFPYEPNHADPPQGASGSELDQQNLSIEAARLQIRKNEAEIANIHKQVDMIQTDQKFQEARQWLFFMARALEHKWNEPLDGLIGGRAMADLFKLRNADELQQMYDAMKLFDDERVLSSRQDDRFDWFSVREDFLGYRRSATNGQPLSYVDPVTARLVQCIFHGIMVPIGHARQRRRVRDTQPHP